MHDDTTMLPPDIAEDIIAITNRVDTKRLLTIIATAKEMRVDLDDLLDIIAKEFTVEQGPALNLYLMGILSLVKNVLTADTVAASIDITTQDILDAFRTIDVKGFDG